MTAPASPVRHPLQGLLLYMASLLLFACMDTTVKYLATHYNVPLVLAARYIVHLVLMIVILAPRQGTRLVQTRRTGLVLVRAGCLAAGSLFTGLALTRMPVAETTAINFLAPMLVVLAAGPILGERIGVIDWIAALAGFAGVLLIARPGGGLDALGVAYALCTVVMMVAYMLLSRVLVRTEHTTAMLFYTALVGSIVYGVTLPWTLRGDAPSLWEILLFVTVGIYGGLGHFMLTVAFRDAPASLLAPITYVQLVWAGLLGWIVFGHVPNGVAVAGMCVVAASGMLIALKSRLTR
jgi:drug/metabolite transporter (DMT)-like permease